MARFAAPRDRTTRLTTAFGLLAIAGGAVILLRASPDGAGRALAICAAGALVLVGALSWALAPSGFALEAGSLVVERPLRPIRIPIAGIRAVAPLPAGAMRGAIRLGGSGGLFGWYGRYRSGTLGAFRLYASRRDGLVLVDAGERYVLSPDRPERFVEALRGRAGLEASPDPAALPPPRPLSRGTKLGIAALVALVPAAIGGILLASMAWSPVGAFVSPDAVVVQRRWVGSLELPLAEIGSARALPPEAMRGARRTAGVALPGVAYGRFRSDALGDFQLYAWRRGPAVLLETAGGKVVLTPEEPERFAAEVGARVERR
jgi:hypothetical protein